jgi:peptidoglycan/LPS O-acetylase OafA/YrhL
MNAPHTRRTLGWSIGALAAGFVVTAALSLGTDVVMHGTGVFPGWGEPMSDGLFAWATVYRVTFTVLGGYVTAKLAPRRPMAHAVWLGLIGTIVAAAGAAATWNAGPAFGPHWYPVTLVLTALPCVWAGGLLRVRSRRLAAA